MKNLGAGYVGFIIGVIFGAVVATLTSYYIFDAAGGDISQMEILGIQECLIERINE